MKKNTILVNTVKNKILSDFDSLKKHPSENHEFQAFLDVLPVAPLNDHPLIKAWRDNTGLLSSRLIINPHNTYFYKTYRSI